MVSLARRRFAQQCTLSLLLISHFLSDFVINDNVIDNSSAGARAFIVVSSSDEPIDNGKEHDEGEDDDGVVHLQGLSVRSLPLGN